VVSADKKAELRQVALGPQIQNLQVIKSGVNAGETVVTDGQLRVVPGGPLDIKTAGATPSSPQSQGTQTGSATPAK
jgi:multidrug efflux system membrane fusion protein